MTLASNESLFHKDCNLPVTGFSYPLTVFGSADRAAAKGQLLRFFKATLNDRGAIHFTEWPFHVFGDAEFASSAEDVYRGRGGHLSTIVLGATPQDQEQAVNNLLRTNSDLVIVDILGDVTQVLSPALVQFAYRSGECLAGAVVATTKRELFEKAPYGLALSEDDFGWVTGHGQRSRCQIFFEGESVSEEFVSWIGQKSSQDRLTPPIAVP